METNGQKISTNPAAKLAALLSKREKLQEELRKVEKQVFELETTYLQDSNHFGNVLKGYDGFLSSSKSTTKYVLLLVGSTCPMFCGNGCLDALLTWSAVGFIIAPRCDSLDSEFVSSMRNKFNSANSDFKVYNYWMYSNSINASLREGFREFLGSRGKGKPKKARLGPRDGRRVRLSSEPDVEDEDDADLGVR